MGANTDTDDTIHAEIIEQAIVNLFNHTSVSDLAEESYYAIEFDERMPLDAHGAPIDCERAETFEDAMVLTSDRGVVLRMSDGSEWDVTVSCRKRPNGAETI